MGIGKKILETRLALGMSQRELAGEEITRNMLSVIEHERANPSLDTLIYLAGKLGRPVGYFLGEASVPGFDRLRQARQAYDRGQWRQCRRLLEQMEPEEVLGREAQLLGILAGLAQAEQELEQGKIPYARQILEQVGQAGRDCPYYTPALEQQRLALLGQAAQTPEELAEAAQALAPEPMLQAKARLSLAQGKPDRALAYLEAMDARDGDWEELMGEACFARQDYAQAAEHYHRIEHRGKPLWKRLQICYAELRDFEKAYYYAVKE